MVALPVADLIIVIILNILKKKGEVVGGFCHTSVDDGMVAGFLIR